MLSHYQTAFSTILRIWATPNVFKETDCDLASIPGCCCLFLGGFLNSTDGSSRKADSTTGTCAGAMVDIDITEVLGICRVGF